jgi:hypothetical protein
VDGASSGERQVHVFDIIHQIMTTPLTFGTRDEARQEFLRWQQMAKDWNRTPMESPDFQSAEESLLSAVNAHRAEEN